MRTNIKKWFEKVEKLRFAEKIWTADEIPVEIIQTHISVILLGKSRVLKLKKPVDFGFLDYTTLEKRRIACEREIELNSRLCPEIYLGKEAVCEDEKGNFLFFNGGKIFDYGVLMKRLPTEGMLDQMVLQNTVTEKTITLIAERLFDFHKNARRGADVDNFGDFENIRYNWEENFEQIKPFINRTISKKDFESIYEWVKNWLEENKNLLKKRIDEGHICDGHGDVRCESICVTNKGVCIFDCIEFNQRFRCGDVANEAAFLAMDLDAYGRPDLAYFFFEKYAEKAGDEELYKLYRFYRCYRAFVRGKVLSFQLDEPELSETEHQKAWQRAEKYFLIASGSAKDLQIPTVIAVAGLSGTGKTSIARAVACELGWRVVSSDAVRHKLFDDEKKPSAYGKGRYDKESNRRTYRKMIAKGIEFLEKDNGVILDATFSRFADREMLRQQAAQIGADFCLIECCLEDEIVRHRLEVRTQKKDGLSDANWDIYKRQKENFEPIEIVEGAHLIINTDQKLTHNRRQIADWLYTKFSG
jgi:aminoglycoside phosphotransferase family enzyme/predicted kinase